MDDDPLESERPKDEVWWERELFRNEKLMDRYMAVLGDDPDWDKWQDPDDLYNKVHFGIDPPERPRTEDSEETADEQPEDLGPEDGPVVPEDDKSEWLTELEAEADRDAEECFEDTRSDPQVNEGYEAISKPARTFACNIFRLKDIPHNAELLFLSAGKVGANLAGGHGLGYDEETICGNIVKCRWALSDCEFCREMLEQLAEETGEPRYRELAINAATIAEAIRDRIARLRKRVWW